jgi:hypothetical protein
LGAQLFPHPPGATAGESETPANRAIFFKIPEFKDLELFQGQIPGKKNPRRKRRGANRSDDYLNNAPCIRRSNDRALRSSNGVMKLPQLVVSVQQDKA